MTKPVIVTRAGKGSPLTRAELDANFENINDAVITVTGDTGSITNSLNETFQISGGVATTSKVVNDALIIDLDNTAVTAGSYTAANITVDAQGRITSAANGSASVTLTGDTGTSTGSSIQIAGGNGIGTASASGVVTVNLNGVYGGDATSSTTVGNNTAVLLAAVATSGSYSDLTNKPSIPSLPSQTGNSGKFLTTNGTDTSWGTAGSGGNNIIIIRSGGYNLTFPSGSQTFTSSTFTVASTGGVSGVSTVTSGFTLPAGTYIFEWPEMYVRTTAINGGLSQLYFVLSDGGQIPLSVLTISSITLGGAAHTGWLPMGSLQFTLATSQTITIKHDGDVATSWWMGNQITSGLGGSNSNVTVSPSNMFVFKFHKTA